MHVTAAKPATAEAEPEEAMEEEEEAAPKAKQGRKPRKASAGAKRPAPGNVKLHDSVSGWHSSGPWCALHMWSAHTHQSRKCLLHRRGWKVQQRGCFNACVPRLGS